MTPLRTRSGDAFATGESRYTSRGKQIIDRLPRIYLQVKIGQTDTEAVLDTGGAYLVLSPDMAVDVELGPAIHLDQIIIRGIRFTGGIHRIPITIPAEAGDSLTFEATAFVPELSPGEPWLLPTYLGWQGCLERIRFAVDPGRDRVYFGALS